MTNTSPIRRWLLACACVMLFMAVFHTIAHVASPQPTGDEAKLFELMKAQKAGLPGAPDRTVFELFMGFSLLISVSGLGFGLFGLVFSLRNQPNGSVRRAALALAITMGLCTILSLLYFFIIPTTFYGLSLLLAIVSLLRDTRPHTA
jgi:hypothetical protein